MQSMTVATDAERRMRKRDLDLIEQQEAKEREEARKNSNFTQIYPMGWKRLIALAKGNEGAFELYTFFAEHIDPSCGAVVCDQKFLADRMGVSTRTIQRYLTYLEEHNAIVRIPVAGRVCAYALDPHEVWKGYDNAKEYAAFTTKTLVNKDGEIQRRIMSMFGKRSEKQADF
ncbi:replication/maintenance protein RepL [Escherichia coli]|uniref:replication/maintenance protein RepL n=1 Tax=Escherichia coli TaxID=562 RepID=UPI003D6D2819